MRFHSIKIRKILHWEKEATDAQFHRCRVLFEPGFFSLCGKPSWVIRWLNCKEQSLPWKGELRIKFTRDILSEKRISPCLHKNESIRLKCNLAYSYDIFFFGRRWAIFGVGKTFHFFGNASQQRETLDKQCILNWYWHFCAAPTKFQSPCLYFLPMKLWLIVMYNEVVTNSARHFSFSHFLLGSNGK